MIGSVVLTMSMGTIEMIETLRATVGEAEAHSTVKPLMHPLCMNRLAVHATYIPMSQRMDQES
jgi:hypothetical protein